MNELAQSFMPLVEQLAQIFNTSTQLVEKNFIKYTTEYGRYIAVKSIIPNFLTTFLIIVMITFISVMILSFLQEDRQIGEEAAKGILVKIICFLLIVLIILTFKELIYYAVSPEMYGLEQLKNLIK